MCVCVCAIMLEKPKSIFDEPEATGIPATRAAAPLNPNKVMAEYMDVMNEIAEKQLALSEWVNDQSNPNVHAQDFSSMSGSDEPEMTSLSASGETAEDRRTWAAEEFGSHKDALQSLIAKAKALKAQMDSL